MNCALCGLEQPLCKSHILPEFIYRPLYDENHRVHVLSTMKVRPRPMEQRGISEKLLCSDCESQISKYERYAKDVLLMWSYTVSIMDGLNYSSFQCSGVLA